MVERSDPERQNSASQSSTSPALADDRNRPFRIGIAGYDLWPHTVAYCRALEKADFCTVSGVWDDEPEHCRRLGELTGAEGFQDLEAFCSSDIEGAIITVRTSERLRVARALADHGKHVLSDKPMASSASECLQVISACRRAGVLLMGGYNFRFWKVWPLMKQVMDGGELGDPIHLYCAYNTGMVRRSEWEDTLDSDWTNPASTPGGAWLTHGDHAIDLTRWLFDTEFVDVVADMRRLRYPQFQVEDYGVAHSLLANGATALIHSDGIAPTGRLDVLVTCAKGGMSYTLRDHTLRVWGAESLGGSVVEFTVPESWQDAMGRLVRTFVHSVRSGETPPVTAIDNLRVMEVVDSVYESARVSRRVAIDLHHPDEESVGSVSQG